jgi:hypothetical protein
MRSVFCLWLAAFSLSARAADTNVLIWHPASDRVDADVRAWDLPKLLEQIARQTGWRVYVEPASAHTTSAKFKNLPANDALRMLLGDLNFALMPRSNAAPQLYVFRTERQNATRLVRGSKPTAKHVANELLLRLKPGADAEVLAKLLGAKVIGRLDRLGLYRLRFDDAAAVDAALLRLQNNSDVLEMDYNYYFEPPPLAQPLASAPSPPLSLQLNPPGDSGRVVVGLVDTSVQSLGDLDKFILKQLSVAGDANINGSELAHGTAMAYAILQAISQQAAGGTSVQILPVDVYGPNASTTSWDVALGIRAVVDGGATVLNLSLASAGDSSILDQVIQQAIAAGIPVYAAAGNQPVSTPTYPAADPNVIAVTALQQKGQLAPYANFGSFVDLALPGACVVYLDGNPWLVQGTSVSTAAATGVAAGAKAATDWSWKQILTVQEQKFAVPPGKP